MNILFTNFCNKNCPYCFAREKLVSAKSLSSNYIKLKELKIIIDFLKRSKQTNVGIMGGEPTLHPEFEDAVAMIIKEGLNITIFSNGLIKKDIVLFLRGIEKSRCILLLNANAPESYTEREWSIFNRTARLFSNGNIKLGFTIYRPDFNMDFLVDLIHRYNLNKEIRLGVAVPILGSRNEYIEPAEYPKVVERLVGFVQKNMATGISFNLDCGFTLCSFTDEQLGKLVRLGTVPQAGCHPIIDVGPDLSVWCCFATSKIWNRKLTDFKDLEAAHNFYNEKFKAFRRVGSTGSCLRCKYLELGHCSGGCLGHTLRAFKLENRLEKLA